MGGGRNSRARPDSSEARPQTTAGIPRRPMSECAPFIAPPPSASGPWNGNSRRRQVMRRLVASRCPEQAAQPYSLRMLK